MRLGPTVFGVDVRPEVSAAHRFEIQGSSGGMVCVGAGGPITGRGADLLIIDDPIKNAEEAASQHVRDRQWEWYLTTALTRLEPGGRVLVVMTHWHEDDLAGRLQTLGGPERYEALRFPALAEADDVLGRQAGEALWPERYPESFLEGRRRELGSVRFAALYQGRPTPAEGVVFKREWFRYYRQYGERFVVDGRVVGRRDCTVFATVDLAASMKTRADYTVVATFAVTPRKELLLLDLRRRRLEGPDQVPLLQRVFEELGPSYIAIESSGYQLALVQEARRQGLPIRELKADRDKFARALVAAARMEGGGIYFPDGAGFVSELEAELLVFPNGAHDDQVDVLAYAALQLAELSKVRATVFTFPMPRLWT